MKELINLMIEFAEFKYSMLWSESNITTSLNSEFLLFYSILRILHVIEIKIPS